MTQKRSFMQEVKTANILAVRSIIEASKTISKIKLYAIASSQLGMSRRKIDEILEETEVLGYLEVVNDNIRWLGIKDLKDINKKLKSNKTAKIIQ